MIKNEDGPDDEGSPKGDAAPDHQDGLAVENADGDTVNGSDNEPGESSFHKTRSGKPAKDTRFKPGRSGNPKGRRKGSRNFRTYVREELARKVTVKTDGHQRTLPKVELMAVQLVNMAVKGDLKSMEYLLKFVDLMTPDEAERQTAKPMADHDRQLILGYIASLREGKKDDDPEESK